MIPVDLIVVHEDDNVALALPQLGALHELGYNLLLQEVLEDTVGPVVGDLVQEFT